MRVRRMTIEDLDQIVNLEKEIFPDPWSWANFEYEIHKNPYSIPLILEKDQDIWVCNSMENIRGIPYC